MTDDEFKTYREERYATALKYYDDQAKWHKRLHLISSFYVLAVSIAIAPLQALGEGAKAFAGVLAPTIALMTGVAALFKFNEGWLSTRTTWDALRHETYWREANIGPYENSADRNALFVARVEALIDKEGSEWRGRQTEKRVPTPKTQSNQD